MRVEIRTQSVGLNTAGRVFGKEDTKSVCVLSFLEGDL